MMNSSINLYVGRTNQSHLGCPLCLLQSCHSPALPSMIAIPPVPPPHILNSISTLCTYVYLWMTACEMSSLARCQPQTAPLQLTQQEVCCFNRVVYLGLTGLVCLCAACEGDHSLCVPRVYQTHLSSRVCFSGHHIKTTARPGKNSNANTQVPKNVLRLCCTETQTK